METSCRELKWFNGRGKDVHVHKHICTLDRLFRGSRKGRGKVQAAPCGRLKGWVPLVACIEDEPFVVARERETDDLIHILHYCDCKLPS